MNLIKCFIEDQGNFPELHRLELLLPTIPATGDSNFDVIHEGIMYNCSVISVDWIIKEQEFSHCSIYIN
jgi:hypothetical protein